jgi:transcriptional regulator with XRE-family HTH domain
MTKLANKKPVPIEQRVFAQNLKAARIATALKQQDIHLLTGLAPSYVSDVERMVSSVSLDSMAALSHAVKVPLFHLLHPEFPNYYDFETFAVWDNYAAQFDRSESIPYERTLFARNFKLAREATTLKKKDLENLTGITNESIVRFERAEVAISLNNAVKMAQVVGKQLYTLLTP